jgi:hypothetical protein
VAAKTQYDLDIVVWLQTSSNLSVDFAFKRRPRWIWPEGWHIDSMGTYHPMPQAHEQGRKKILSDKSELWSMRAMQKEEESCEFNYREF